MPAALNVLLVAATEPEVEPPITPIMLLLATNFCATRLCGGRALLHGSVARDELDLQAHRLRQRLDRELGPRELLLADEAGTTRERREHPDRERASSS